MLGRGRKARPTVSRSFPSSGAGRRQCDVVSGTPWSAVAPITIDGGAGQSGGEELGARPPDRRRRRRSCRCAQSTARTVAAKTRANTAAAGRTRHAGPARHPLIGVAHKHTHIRRDIVLAPCAAAVLAVAGPAAAESDLVGVTDPVSGCTYYAYGPTIVMPVFAVDGGAGIRANCR